MTKRADPKRIQEIRRLLLERVPKTVIARKFGISRSRLYQILNSK